MSARVTARLARAWTSERARVFSSMPRVVLTGHPNEVYALGHLRGGDALLETFDARTGERLRALELARQFQPHGSPAVYVRGGDALVMISSAYTTARVERIRLHDAGTEVVLQTDQHFSNFAVSLDGRLIALRGRRIALYDALGGRVVDEFQGGSNPWGAISFSPDGAALAWACGEMEEGDDQGGLWVRDLRRGASRRITREVQHASTIALARDARRVWVGYHRELSCWDVDEGRRESTPPTRYFSDRVVAVRADGSAVLVTEGVRLGLVAVEVGAGRLSPPRDTAWTRLEGEIAPDARAAACVRGGTLALYDLEAGEERSFHEGHGAWVGGIAYAPEGGRVATVSADSTLRVWDPGPAETLSTFEDDRASGLLDVAWAPDGRAIYTVNGKQTLLVWDIERLLDVTPAASVTMRGEGLVVSPDGSRAINRTGARAAPDGIFSLIDLGRGCALPVDQDALFKRTVLREEDEDERGLAAYVAYFAADGAEVHVLHAPAPAGETLRTVLDARTGAVLREEALDQRVPISRTNACAPDGRHAVFESRAEDRADQQYEIWDLVAGECLHGRARQDYALHLHADSRHCVIATDGAMEVLRGAESVCTIACGHHRPTAMAFSPDGRTLLVGTANGQILEYELREG